MRITYIVSAIKRSVFFEITALELAKRGYEVDYILIGNHSDDFEQFLKKHGFSNVSITVKSMLLYPLYVFRVYKRLKNFKPQLVHTHLVTANITGLVAARLAGIKKRVSTAHSGKTDEGIRGRIFDGITQKNASFIIAITEIVQQILSDAGYPLKKISVINYGFDLSRFQNPDRVEVQRLKAKYNVKEKYPVIGVIARPVEWKGLQYIIPAFAKILEKFPGALLCLFNYYSPHDEYYKIIDKALEELPADSFIRVDFETNVFDLYQLFDMFVHVPVDDRCEAFGQVYVEALASGIPSVFTISGVANDFIRNKKNALVVDYKNTDEIFTVISELLVNKDLVLQIKEQGKKDTAELFGVDKYMQKLINTYENL